MLVINYNGNKPTTDVFKYSVLGNNNADVVRFCLSKQQGNIDLEGYKVYAQAYCEEDDFIDKVEITDNVSIVENQLQVDWTLLRKHTVNRQLKVSLSFEDEDNEVVWQTQLVRINICDGINADEEIENSYPTIIEELKNNKVSCIQVDEHLLVSKAFEQTKGKPFMTTNRDIVRISKVGEKYGVSCWREDGYGSVANITGDNDLDSIINDTIEYNFYISEENIEEHLPKLYLHQVDILTSGEVASIHLMFLSKQQSPISFSGLDNALQTHNIIDLCEVRVNSGSNYFSRSTITSFNKISSGGYTNLNMTLVDGGSSITLSTTEEDWNNAIANEDYTVSRYL